MSGPREPAPVIIVGTGAAGMSAALRLASAGRAVTMITKGELGDGATAWAQGGLAAVVDPSDTLTGHVDDTLVAGAGLCDPETVAALVAAAPQTIASLLAHGAQFDRNADGSLALGLEGGHHARRIVHTGDSSGAEVARTLAAQVRAAIAHGMITLLEHTAAVDVVLDGSGAVRGLRVIDDRGHRGELGAAAVVLASGGIGQAWPSTTNPPTATGDGLALAIRAGAVLRDLEFVQFHPTVLAVPAEWQRPGDRDVLISEAVRGEGARLVDRNGRPIMAGKHPLGDLAPRDVVAAAIHAHLLASGDDHVYLDGTGFGPELWERHFPAIAAMCRDRGIDPVTEPIPVRPAQHYHCGGVRADLDGRTSVPGLYAVGEVAATGVQGANRLASNSLTEALIAGDRVGALLGTALPELVEGPEPPSTHPEPVEGPEPPSTLPEPVEGPTISRAMITAPMARWCGVQRDEDGLLSLSAALAAVHPTTQPRDVAALELLNLHTVARAVALAALLRTESRGCHRRSDHPEADEQWRRHLDLRLDVDGRLRPLDRPARVAA